MSGERMPESDQKALEYQVAAGHQAEAMRYERSLAYREAEERQLVTLDAITRDVLRRAEVDSFEWLYHDALERLAKERRMAERAMLQMGLVIVLEAFALSYFVCRVVWP